MTSGSAWRTATAFALVVALPAAGSAQSALSGDPISITRAPGPIAIDGDLSDEGWQQATRVDTWYEINPGDNVPPPVRNLGYLTYDDRSFYAAFEFEDPDPSAIRAPYADRDNIGYGSNDYGGIIIDPRHRLRAAGGVQRNRRRPGGGRCGPKDSCHESGPFCISNSRSIGGGALIGDSITPGFFMETRFNGFMLCRASIDRVRSGDRLFDRRQFGYFVQFNPSRVVSQVAVDGAVGASLLLAYKLNWQSVMFGGYGDDRTLSDQSRLEKVGRQFFVKISYAFQR